MKCRKNVRDLTPDEKAAYVQAVIDLKNTRPSIIAGAQAAGATSRYDDYVWVHRQVMGGAHGGPAFTPWHREFLKQFERDLQDVSGDPDITIPYWDWTTARTAADSGWPFTDDFMGGFGTGADNRVVTGRFAEAGGEWVLNVRTGAAGVPGGPPRDNTTYLRRNVSPPTPGPPDSFPLPSQTNARNCLARIAYDANNPWFENPTTITLAQVNASFRKYLEYVLHNGPHVWVGGNMEPMTSPNDPIFFLHHCNIDRLWAVWQQKQSAPATDYLPPAGTTASHDIDDSMVLLEAGNFNWPVAARPQDVLDHQALGFWYASDLPRITLNTPSVDFGNVPENLTTYRPVQFGVRTCRPVKFRITGLTAGTNFSAPPAQGMVTVNHNEALDPVEGEVFVQFHASGALSTAQAATVTIEAFIEDTEGYYAAPPAVEHIIDSWTVTLLATPVPRQRSAIALVLDRSGSMSANAGGTSTRSELLQGAVQVFSELMHDTDAVGLVGYDDIVDRHLDITVMGTTAPLGAGRQGVADVLAGPNLEPRGATAIGAGILEGADVLQDGQAATGATPYDQLAMVVLTDGNENVEPYVGSPAVQAIVTNRTYAIGFGRENEVSAPVLGSFANASGGYMLITGEMTPAQQQFKLTKYFVQILAGITRNDIVVDPQGDLLIGAEHRIPFKLTEADVSFDAIALCPYAFLLDLKLQTPGGAIIDSTTGGPNARLTVNRQNTFYRVLLPALAAQPAGSHAGDWTAILSISKEKIRDLLKQREHLASFWRAFQGRSLPYSLIVQSYSNLRFTAHLQQRSQLPGEELKLYAALTEYDVPVTRRANVVVEITDPAAARTFVPLVEYAPGRFQGSYPTTISGIYQCRFKATGYSLRGKPFQREETRTAGLFQPVPGVAVDTAVIDQVLAADRKKLCELLRCLLSQRGIVQRLEQLGLEPKSLLECFERYCQSNPRRPQTGRLGLREAVMSELNKPPQLIETALLKNLLGLLETPEQLGIQASPKPDKLEARKDEHDPHRHMEFFPVFILEGDKLRRREPGVHDPAHCNERGPGHEHCHGDEPHHEPSEQEKQDKNTSKREKPSKR